MSESVMNQQYYGSPLRKSHSPVEEGVKPKSLREGRLASGGETKSGRWTKEEHFRFIEALIIYGKEWKKVQQHVGTRTSTQARSHAQKFFGKLQKKNLTLEQYRD